MLQVRVVELNGALDPRNLVGYQYIQQGHCALIGRDFEKQFLLCDKLLFCNPMAVGMSQTSRFNLLVIRCQIDDELLQGGDDFGLSPSCLVCVE